MKICIIELKLRNFRSPILNSCKSVICFFQRIQHCNHYFRHYCQILDTSVLCQILVSYSRHYCSILDTSVRFQTLLFYFWTLMSDLGTIVLFTTLVSDSRAQRSNFDTSQFYFRHQGHILDSAVLFQTLVSDSRHQFQFLDISVLDTCVRFQTSVLFQTLMSDSRLVFSFRLQCQILDTAILGSSVRLFTIVPDFRRQHAILDTSVHFQKLVFNFGLKVVQTK